MEDVKTLEDMDEPCPLDICDGSGLLEEDDRVLKCPHAMDTDQFIHPDEI